VNDPELEEAMRAVRPRWAPEKRITWAGVLAGMLAESRLPRKYLLARLHEDPPERDERPEWWFGEQRRAYEQQQRRGRRTRASPPAVASAPKTNEYGEVIL